MPTILICIISVMLDLSQLFGMFHAKVETNDSIKSNSFQFGCRLSVGNEERQIKKTQRGSGESSAASHSYGLT